MGSELTPLEKIQEAATAMAIAHAATSFLVDHPEIMERFAAWMVESGKFAVEQLTEGGSIADDVELASVRFGESLTRAQTIMQEIRLVQKISEMFGIPTENIQVGEFVTGDDFPPPELN